MSTRLLACALISVASAACGSPSLLAGQIEFKGQPTDVAAITYKTKSGDVITQDLALRGFVTLYVDPQTTTSQLSSAATIAGGRILDAIPHTGLYTVQVIEGQEADFLAAIFVNGYVLDGEPTTADVNACVAAIDSFAAGATTCSAPHGNHVEAVAERGGACVTEIDKGPLVIQALAKLGTFATDGILRPQVERLLIKEMEAAHAGGRRAVINISMQSTASVSGDINGARTTCKSAPSAPICKSVQQGQKEFLRGILAALAAEPASVRDNTLVVISAGNAGVDITQAISDVALDPRYAEAFKHVKIVGSTDASGAVSQDNNYGGNGTMVYAPGKNVPTLPGCMESGTSFAAPEVARVMSAMWDAAPSLTSDQVTRALDDALSDSSCGGSSGGNRTLPQSGGATTAGFIACAQMHAQALAPSPGGGGGGGGYDCSNMYGSAAGGSGCSVCAITAHCLCNGTSVSCWYSGSDGYMTSKCSFDAASSGSTSGYSACIQGIASAVVHHCCPPHP